MFVVARCIASIDGCIDDTSPERLILSNQQEFDAVDVLRSSCDAILVGASTVRSDDPRLVVRSDALRDERRARGASPDPKKITVTRSGNLDPEARFFAMGEGEKLVYCEPGAAAKLQARVGARATVLPLAACTPQAILADLETRNVQRLLIEGGTAILTQFLSAGCVDELQVAIAPFFVGETNAPRIVGDGMFPHSKDSPCELIGTERYGSIVCLKYRLRPHS